MKEFRLATNDDVEKIVSIYDAIIAQEETGPVLCGWKRGVYPTKETALTGINEKDLFVLTCDGVIVASARINQVQLDEYALVKWGYNAEKDKVMVIHTLTVDPSCKGCGYGREFMHFFEEYAKSKNAPYLRLDTNKKNTRAFALYRSLGYNFVSFYPCKFEGLGVIELAFMEKFID